MKIIFTFIFILSIFTTALHEMLPDHDESSCAVCVLVQHDSGLVPSPVTTLPSVDFYYLSISFALKETPTLKLLNINSRAPPSLS